MAGWLPHITTQLKLDYTVPDRRTDGGRVEVIIMLSQLSDVVVGEAGAELGNNNTLSNCSMPASQML